METLVHSIESHNITQCQAADYFARSFFDTPRKAKCLKDQPGFFRLVDGNALYQVRHVPAVPLRSVARWEIYRLD